MLLRLSCISLFGVACRTKRLVVRVVFHRRIIRSHCYIRYFAHHATLHLNPTLSSSHEISRTTCSLMSRFILLYIPCIGRCYHFGPHSTNCPPSTEGGVSFCTRMQSHHIHIVGASLQHSEVSLSIRDLCYSVSLRRSAYCTYVSATRSLDRPALNLHRR